jgi:hypothetical protein
MPLPLLPQGTLDFTGITREDMLVRLQNLYNQLNPEWDDFSPAFPENLLLEGMVFITDLIRGTMEERVRQLNWATITDRLAAARLSRISGFRLPGGSPATLTGRFATADGNPTTVGIPIPEGTIISTREEGTLKRYRVTQSDGYIPPNEVGVNVSCEQAEEEVETFTSSLEPNIELLLDKGPFIDGSAVVIAGNGTYVEYLSFLGVSSTTRAMVIFVDDENKARIRFGNGINGSVPQGTISVRYKVGGGVAGEVSAGAVWSIETAIVNDLSQSANLVFTNAASSQPGTDPMSVSEARVRGPQSLRTRERQVNEDDFEYVATSVPGIARAFLATSDISSIIAEDTARLELVAFGSKLTSGRFEPAIPSDAKLQEVRQQVTKYSDKPPVMGYVVTVVAAELTTVNVSVRIHKTSNVTATDAAANIRAALKDFFAVALEDRTPNTQIDFGARLLGSDGDPDYLIPWSSVFDAILGAEGVRYVTPASNDLLLNNVRGSVKLAPRRFPKLGTVIIYDDDNGGQQI